MHSKFEFRKSLFEVYLIIKNYVLPKLYTIYFTHNLHFVINGYVKFFVLSNVYFNKWFILIIKERIIPYKILISLYKDKKKGLW